MFGNWGFLLLVYILPLFLPSSRFMTLAAFMFLFAEVLMHFVIFPIRLKNCYNPGLITTIGLGVIGCCYFFGGAFDASMYVWYDWVIAVVWFAVVFVFSFRSKLYWNLGKKPGYPLSQQSAFGLTVKVITSFDFGGAVLLLRGRCGLWPPQGSRRHA